MLKKYLVLFLTASIHHACAQTLPKGPVLLTQAINNLVKPADRKAAVGIKIVSPKNDYCLYQKNPDQLFIPASNTKLFTAAAALDILGPEFRFETRLLTDQQSSTQKIGNLYLQGGGDPSLETAHLEEMVKKLKARGIREIKGNIIIDASIFDSNSTGPGWSKGDGPIFDKSPVNGLMLNHCCLTVHVKPARIPGHKPSISLDPAVGYITIENKARTTITAKKHSLHVSRSSKNEKKIIITGTIATKSKPKAYLIVLDNPHVYAAHVLMLLLKKHGVHCRGSILVGKTPKKAAILSHHYSEPVSTLVRSVMKSSDNLYADALYKRMGALTFGEPGTWGRGKKAVDAFLLNEVGLPTSKVDLYDGSGLSHANRVSPNAMAYLLSWTYKKSPYKNIFIDSLPVSGIDGTLRHRMRHKLVHARVKAKTGSLSGVSSLAGYITPKNGSPLVFVIVVNRKNKSAVEFKRKLEDHLCTLLAAHAFSIS